MFKSFKKLIKGKEPKNQQEIFDQVIGVIRSIADEGDLDNIKLEPTTELEDMGFDSIKHMTLLLSMEDIVNKDIQEIVEEVDIASIQTIQDVVDAVIDLS